MQVMRTTGREIARDLKINSFSADRDLRVPNINVRIGANYLYRLVRAFNGHVPLALAAYNAGIGNIRLWMKSRADLLPDQMSNADADSEIWMDEMPWTETTGYVRNILRNLLIYKYLAQGQESQGDQNAQKFSFPIWPISS
jgi:soluble lytic murein transglycosylase